MSNNRDYKYENDNRIYDNKFPEKEGIKCKKYEECKTVLPKWWYQHSGNYFCVDCGLQDYCERALKQRGYMI